MQKFANNCSLGFLPIDYADLPPGEAIAFDIENRWSGDYCTEIKRRYGELDGELPANLGTIAIAPVLAGEPQPKIARAIQNYTSQKVDAVLLHINGTRPQGENHLGFTQEIIEDERKKHPGLPIATTSRLYDGPPHMSDARSLPWDIAEFHLYNEKIEGTVTGISNDIDTHSMSSNYSAELTGAVQNEVGASLWGTDVTYALPGDPSWPINRLVRLLDGMQSLVGKYGEPLLYEASVAMSFDTYASTNGWGCSQGDIRASANVSEGVYLLKNTAFARNGVWPRSAREAKVASGFRYLPEASLVTSGRRFVWRFAQYAQTGVFDLKFKTGNDDVGRYFSSKKLEELAATPLSPAKEAAMADKLIEGFYRNGSPVTLLEIQRLRHEIGIPVAA